MPDPAATWDGLAPHERRRLLAGRAPYTDATAGSPLWEADPHRPGMRPSSTGRLVAGHGRRVRHSE